MSIETVPMYRVVCDEPNCGESAQEGDYYAWIDASDALQEASDADWTTRHPYLHLCPEHGRRTVCMGEGDDCPRRDVTEAADGWVYCPDHIAEGES